MLFRSGPAARILFAGPAYTIGSTNTLQVTDAEYDAARAGVSEALLEAIRDGIDHVRRFNEQVCSHGDWSLVVESTKTRRYRGRISDCEGGAPRWHGEAV